MQEKNFADIVNKVAYGKESIVLTRRGQDVATLVSIDELGRNLPEPNTTRMKGNKSFHKIRTGDYRIIYEIHNDRVIIMSVKAAHRKDVYKGLR